MTSQSDDDSPAPAEVTDSGSEKEEEDPEILEGEEEEDPDEEDPEEEEVEEEEEKEEENLEDRVEEDMDISDSPIHVFNHRQDVRQDIQYEGTQGLPSNAHATEGCSAAGEGMKQVDARPKNDRKRLDSRSAASQRETTSMSPGDDTSDRNKRPAIICDFFAKGWCIRGSSCKFVHMKDNPNGSRPQPERDIAAASGTREAQLDEGSRDITERPRSSRFPDSLASSSGSSFAFSSHLSSEKIEFSEYMGMQKQHQFREKRILPSPQGEESNMGDSTDEHKFHPPRGDPFFFSSLKFIGRDDQKRKCSTDGYNNLSMNKGNPIFRNGLHPEPGSFLNGSIVPSSKYSRENHSSYLSSMEEQSAIWDLHRHRDHTSPLASLSLNSSSSNFFTAGLFPTSRISPWPAFSSPSSHSYVDPSHLGTQKLLDRGRDKHSSTRSSPMKKMPSISVPLRSAGLKSKISSDDWEPSVPFRPSFILPAFRSSSGSLSDPLHDSIELPKSANIASKASFRSEGATNGNRSHEQIDESGSGTQRPACEGDTNSMSSHNTYREKVLDNSCFTGEQNSPATEAETVGTTNLYGDSGHKNDTKVDRFRETKEVDGEHLTDGYVQQERALKNFHPPLVDLVKNLLKPKWHEGSLSKDAHNLIVKKAVEKVIGAFQPHQIPPTIETAMQYLSTSHSKITKLVEGYVEKYGKS